MGANIFDLLTLTLNFDLLFKNFNIGHIFWMVSDRAFMFHVCIPCEKILLDILYRKLLFIDVGQQAL
jgi:hypothetical protein